MAQVPSAALTLDEAVPLAHALVAEVARREEIRLLLIKGPVLAAQGLREPGRSADVDAWVDPAELDRLTAALVGNGWAQQVPYGVPGARLHSRTFRHPLWPCEIDLHDRFPGFLAPPQDVFEVLWSRRSSIRLSGQQVPCPDVASHVAIAALHYLRDTGTGVHGSKLADLVARVRQLDDHQAQDLVVVAEAGGAVEALRPFLEQLGMWVESDDRFGEALRDWRVRSGVTSTVAVPWVVGLLKTPLWRWPGFVWRATWSSEAELRRSAPSTPPGVRGSLHLRVRRWRRGLAALPRAVVEIWRIRRKRPHG